MQWMPYGNAGLVRRRARIICVPIGVCLCSTIPFFISHSIVRSLFPSSIAILLQVNPSSQYPSILYLSFSIICFQPRFLCYDYLVPFSIFLFVFLVKTIVTGVP